MPQTDLALVLTGGGARAAYQVGVLRYIASAYPDFAPGILTGVSAGGIIAIHLAARPGTFAEAADTLVHLWTGLTPDHVFRVDAADLSGRVMRWGLRLLSGGLPGAAHSVGTRSLLDTTPLWDLLRQTLHEIGRAHV